VGIPRRGDTSHCTCGALEIRMVAKIVLLAVLLLGSACTSKACEDRCVAASRGLRDSFVTDIRLEANNTAFGGRCHCEIHVYYSPSYTPGAR
jgi:hypothetical protein